MSIFIKSFVYRFFMVSSLIYLISCLSFTTNDGATTVVSFSSIVHAVPPPRGASKDPIERNRKARAEKIKREKARRDSINCYITERKKLEDGGLTCIYKCPKGRTESNSIGPGFRCPTMMNVLRRE